MSTEGTRAQGSLSQLRVSRFFFEKSECGMCEQVVGVSLSSMRGQLCPPTGDTGHGPEPKVGSRSKTDNCLIFPLLLCWGCVGD